MNKKAWYLQSWFLCIIFMFSILVIPFIIGAVLLILSLVRDKEIRKSIEAQMLEIGAMDVVKKQEYISSLAKEVEILEYKQKKAQQEIAAAQKEIIVLEEQMLLQSFGLYKPQYDFVSSDHYKAELNKIRTKQKDLIKNNTAATGNMGWTVNGSKSQGNKMVKDMQKLLLRAFNSECDEIVSRVKYNNFDTSLKRITSSYEAISKLGKIMSIAITQPYYNAKIDELRLALEYQQKKQQEKEEQKELRAQMREDAKVQKEIEEQRKKLDKEQTHYQSALTKIHTQLEKATGSEREELLAKQSEIERNLADIDKALIDVDYRQANQKAGYVYIVSNIGAFGEDVYKIGMTRRLDPEDRVDELGSASVPFNFDTHAMIFSDDAPKLEAELHKAFEDRKLNWVNTRREFFRVSLDEIKEIINKYHDKTAEFTDVAIAEQYRISEKMRQSA
ncbi:MAG: DUF4041 domain-containing protein [Firmicutes bacterium]|nr:DUF4041 domain-containing protein [Bacillota bacterium]